MNRTPINWVKNPDGTPGYTWNPITGCLNGCEYCYARRLANTRLRERYLANDNLAGGYRLARGVLNEDAIPPSLDPFYPRFWPARLPTYFEGKPKGVFVCVSGDTEVSLANGSIKQIKDICIGDVVIGYNNGRVESNKVTAIRETRSPEVYRLQVNGNKLIGSPNHPVLTLSGYKRLDKLGSEEYICMYEHTQSLDNENPQMRRGFTTLIGDRHSLPSGDNRRRGDYLIQENATRLSPPDFGDSKFRRTAHQMVDSDILAEAYRSSQWFRGALSAGASNRLRDCSLSGGDRVLLGGQEVTVSACKEIYPSQNIATLERTTLARDGRTIQRCADAQFSWHRLTSIERIRKAEILYDITTTSHNFIANGIVTHNCDMSDLFGVGIPEEWTREVLGTIKRSPTGWRFYLLTKRPENLMKFSPFPDNCFVGVSATDGEMYQKAMIWLAQVEAKVKYISFEPLLGRIEFYDKPIVGLNWVIVGAQTKPTVMPEIEWVQEIVRACDKAGAKVFLKNNLEPLWTQENRVEPFFIFSRSSPGATEIGKLRQEMP